LSANFGLRTLGHCLASRWRGDVQPLHSAVRRPRQTYPVEPDADSKEARTLRPLQAAAITYCMPSALAPGKAGAGQR